MLFRSKNKKIMTAAPRGRTANPFGFGAGLLNPVKVENPGLLYDAGPKDYIKFLCGIGYDNSSLRRVKGDHSYAQSSAQQLPISIIIPYQFQNSMEIARSSEQRQM